MHEVSPSIVAAMHKIGIVFEEATRKAPVPIPRADIAIKGLRPYLSLKVHHMLLVKTVKLLSNARRAEYAIWLRGDTSDWAFTTKLTRRGKDGMAKATLIV